MYFTRENCSFACSLTERLGGGWRGGGGTGESKPPASHPFNLGLLPLALFGLRNINHCFLFSRISPISYPSRTPTSRLFLSHFPYPSCPLLSRAPTPLPCTPLLKGFANPLADDLFFDFLVVCFSSLRCVPKMTRITQSSPHPLLLVTVWYSRRSIRPGK